MRSDGRNGTWDGWTKQPGSLLARDAQALLSIPLSFSSSQRSSCLPSSGFPYHIPTQAAKLEVVSICLLPHDPARLHILELAHPVISSLLRTYSVHLVSSSFLCSLSALSHQPVIILHSLLRYNYLAPRYRVVVVLPPYSLRTPKYELRYRPQLAQPEEGSFPVPFSCVTIH